MKVLEDFLAIAPTKSFNKGEILMHQGDDPQQAYIVKKGVVRCFDISSDGNQQLIWLVSEGEIFPASLLLQVDKTVRFFYSAFVDVEVYAVDKTEFAAFLKTNPDVLFEVCTEITRKLADLHYRVNATGKPKAREKILHSLAFLADRFKSYRKSKNKKVELSLPLTHQDIADLVGLTRETTATTLKNLKEEGFIDYDKQKFLVHREKIEKALW